MDFHRPSVRAARARHWPRAIGRRWLPALGLAAGLTAAGCGSTTDDVSAPPDADLPVELVAADGDSASAGDGGAEAGDDSDIVVAAVEDETPPAEAVDPGSVELSDDAPAEVIDRVAEEMASAGDLPEAGDGGQLLDAVEPVDRNERPAIEPDGRARNGYGELLVLDDEASLACANVEIAIGHLDEGLAGVAGDHVRFGAERAEASGIADIRSWADPLRAAAELASSDPAALIGFLTVCTEGGYEL